MISEDFIVPTSLQRICTGHLDSDSSVVCCRKLDCFGRNLKHLIVLLEELHSWDLE
jgi:hypothetical protein